MSRAAAKRPSVLIVDDDEVVRDSLHDELERDYEVETAAGGREALERVGRRVFDVVISDLRMPDVSGIEVLERVHGLAPDTVRILLTGFLDEDARQATLRENAPFKIGKPWHGSIEVTLKRALEHRELTRRLTRQLTELGQVDEDLASARGLLGLARVLLVRLAQADGVVGAAVTTEVGGARHDLLRMLGRDAAATPEWSLDESLVDDGGVRLAVEGRGGPGRAFAQALALRARRFLVDSPALRLATAAARDEGARAQLLAMARRADVGAMSASVMHELAAHMQHFSNLVADIELDDASGRVSSDVRESLHGAHEASERILALFRQLRGFVSGKPPAGPERVRVFDIVDHAVALCRGFARPRLLGVDLGDAAGACVEGELALLTQVLVNLLRNAVDATPSDGTIDVSAWRDGASVFVSVTDDGAGVPAELHGRLFEPFATSKAGGSGTGLGLALSAMIVKQHRGELAHVAPLRGGARFVLRLPLLG